MKELRNYDLQLSNESRSVEGYALIFNSESNDLGGFKEVIDPAAVAGVLERSDILCLLNHNVDRGVLARSNKGVGSLELTVDEKGLKYRFEAPNTALGEELLEGLKRGDISTSSFAFTVDNEKWSKKEDGSYLRTITGFKELFDVSPVYRPAYDATSVQLSQRSLDGLNKLKEQDKKEDLKEYFNNLKSQINA